ncbi:hypothetical protein B0A50_02216 [Salinomyces thailandicus]|uniref:Uncharacterized protein n=1 Tax=Salinomyces thailandicus TaxID=706561 RepID=A0A4U0U7X6_9PEZI|nr:hypothetical protein B0A50_02216 [Salinomyces thailandica]
MALRGLDISAESKFEFTLPKGCKIWPAPQYGQYSPHVEGSKAPNPSARRRRQSILNRPAKAAKARMARRSAVKEVGPEPSCSHLPLTPRDKPLHFLTIPGELRDMVYDLIVPRNTKIIAQNRPCFERRPGRKGSREIIRRYPLEPKIAQVSRQSRKEVLSIFYAANTFIFRRSQNRLLRNFSITDPAWLSKWFQGCPSSEFLRRVTLQFDACTRNVLYSVTFTLEKDSEEQIRAAHDFNKPQYCACLENTLVTQVLNPVTMSSNLAYVATMLAWRRRNAVLILGVRDDGADGMYRFPTARCLICHKRHPTHVGID